MLVMAFLLASAPAHAAVEPANWVLIDVYAGHKAGSGTLEIDIAAAGRRNEPLMIGWAESGGYISVHHTRSAEVVVAPRRAGVGELGAFVGGGSARIFGSPRISLRARQHAVFVIFFPGGRIEGRPRTKLITRSGALRSRVTTGSGAEVVSLGEASGGDGVVVGTAAFGGFSHSDVIDRGIIGSQVSLCESCAGAWRAPDRTRGDWSTEGSGAGTNGGWMTEGDPAFAGPRGRWTWSLDGVMTGQDTTSSVPGAPVLAAYAPIGEAWRLFR